MFAHEDPEFADLVRIVAAERGLNVGLVEKDYWVTHTLWALHQTGLDIWFKGGTSLSKGFDLIRRFSEDLDLKIEPGSVKTLRAISNWKSMNTGAVAQRRAFFASLKEVLEIPGAPVEIDGRSVDQYARSANYRVLYPGQFAGELAQTMRPFVLLEVGSARVAPFECRSLGSFVHAWLEANGHAGEYEDNIAEGVRCVHPLVTLLEKLDAITRRYDRRRDPATYIRHYEDAAQIILAEEHLPMLGSGVAELAQEMIAEGQIASLSPEHAAFKLAETEGWEDLDRAFEATAPMFWGDRVPLGECCRIIAEWLATNSGALR